MPMVAIANPYTFWPPDDADFITTWFSLNADVGVQAVEDFPTGFPGQATVLVDLRGQHVRVSALVTDPPTPRPGLVGDAHLQWGLYITTLGVALDTVRKRTDARIVAYMADSRDSDSIMRLERNRDDPTAARLLHELFHEVRYEAPPNSVRSAMSAGIFLKEARRPVGSSGLTKNPFFNPDILDVTHEVRRNLRHLMRELKIENAEEFEFERKDLISLMRQTLTILGEDGDIPQRAVRAIPEEGHKLSLRLSNMEQISGRLLKVYENGSSLFDHILSLWHHLF